MGDGPRRLANYSQFPSSTPGKDLARLHVEFLKITRAANSEGFRDVVSPNIRNLFFTNTSVLQLLLPDLRSPKRHSWFGSMCRSVPSAQKRSGRKKKAYGPDQLRIIGFNGKNAENKQLPNGSWVAKLAVATAKSWRDEWKNKTQWHNVIALGLPLIALAERRISLVQGELGQREYKRTIMIRAGEKCADRYS